jgi:hypothetical protein
MTRDDREGNRAREQREVVLCARLVTRRSRSDPRAWVTEDEVLAYLWLHTQADTITAMLALLDDPSSGVIAGFPSDDRPAVTRMARDDLRPIDRDPAQQARARAALVAQRAGYRQQIRQLERGEITATYPDDADEPVFRPGRPG